MGFISVMRIMYVIHVVRFGHFVSIIIVMSVICVMRVMHDIHVMIPIPFLLKNVSYVH